MSSHSDPYTAHRRLQRFPSKGKLPRQAYPTASSAGVRAVSWQVLPRYDVMEMSASLPTQSRGRSSKLSSGGLVRSSLLALGTHLSHQSTTLPQKHHHLDLRHITLYDVEQLPRQFWSRPPWPTGPAPVSSARLVAAPNTESGARVAVRIKDGFSQSVSPAVAFLQRSGTYAVYGLK